MTRSGKKIKKSASNLLAELRTYRKSVERYIDNKRYGDLKSILIIRTEMLKKMDDLLNKQVSYNDLRQEFVAKKRKQDFV